jgi:CheY-like chemotaxis protein
MRTASNNVKNILIVDDDPSTLILLSELTRYLFHEINIAPVRIFLASSGEEGIVIGNAHSIDLLITDYHMPGMNGHELIRSMKSGDGDTKTILMSSDHHLLHFLSTKFNIEIDAVLEKPVSRRELKKIIRCFFVHPVNVNDTSDSESVHEGKTDLRGVTAPLSKEKP